MARKKVQKYKARRDEHLGEERHMRKRFYDGEYAGMDPRRKLEREDAEMLSESHSSFANLPQEVVMRSWPKAHDYADYDLDDTIKGVNELIDENESGLKRHKGGNKW